MDPSRGFPLIQNRHSSGVEASGYWEFDTASCLREDMPFRSWSLGVLESLGFGLRWVGFDLASRVWGTGPCVNALVPS